MLTEAGHKQPDQASPYPRNSSDDNTDVSTLFFPVNFLEPTTPETFLELDPAGFVTYSGGATKGSCASSGFGRMSTTQSDCWAKLEPSREPCTDEIPWPDLVFWLGNVLTGEVVCSCAQCSGHRAMRQRPRQHRYSPYERHMQLQMHQQQQHRRRVSSRVPVINLPRIEGVN
jgi:hypothetical protein